MKINLSMRGIMCVLLMVFVCSLSFGGERATDNVEIYKCEVKPVSLTSISVVSIPPLYDGQGKLVDTIERGGVELIVAGNQVKLKDGGSKKIEELIGKKASWKVKPIKPTDGVIVGLVEMENSVDLLIFLENKWWLLRIYPNRVGIIETELVLGKDNLKLATIKMGEKAIISDDQEIVKAFTRVIGE